MSDTDSEHSPTGNVGAKISSPNRHDVNRRFSRMLHKFVGRRLLSDPTYLAATRARLLNVVAIHPRDKETWLKILDLPLSEIARVISRDDSEMARLRSVTPFLLPGKFQDPAVRRMMLRKVARGVTDSETRARSMTSDDVAH